MKMQMNRKQTIGEKREIWQIIMMQINGKLGLITPFLLLFYRTSCKFFTLLL